MAGEEDNQSVTHKKTNTDELSIDDIIEASRKINEKLTTHKVRVTLEEVQLTK